MDPNTALSNLRNLTAMVINTENLEHSDQLDLLDSLAEQVEALDEWLTRGGFLPSAWQSQGPRQ